MKTHRFDGLSFVSGLVITLIGLAFLIPANPGDVFGYLSDIGDWFWPAVLIAVGVAVLAPLASGRDSDDDDVDSGSESAV